VTLPLSHTTRVSDPNNDCRKRHVLTSTSGKGGKKNNARDAEIEAREPHHKGKGKKNARDAEIEAREPHHKGKGGKAAGGAGAGGLASLFGRDAEVEAREPHHKGKGGKKNN
jgi:hypothetical protein